MSAQANGVTGSEIGKQFDLEKALKIGTLPVGGNNWGNEHRVVSTVLPDLLDASSISYAVHSWQAQGRRDKKRFTSITNTEGASWLNNPSAFITT